MINQFSKLSADEQRLLCKAPVLVSVLASCFSGINKCQTADAIRQAHLKTFRAIPLLWPYYAEVENLFKGLFESASKQYFPFTACMRTAINKELERAKFAIGKLDSSYAQALYQSLEKYANHVKMAGHAAYLSLICLFPFLD
jgi:hypothetical protein